MRVILVLLFIIATTGYGFGQDKLSKEDSVKLAATWNELKPYLLQQVKATSVSIADTVHCELCLKENQSTLDTKMNKPYFQEKGLSVFNQQKKIKTTIQNEQPDYGMIVYGNEASSPQLVWIVYYTYWKQNELAKGHEGASVLFEFRKSKNGFELFKISTIP